MAKTHRLSGYTDCACRDCFEVAISRDARRPALCAGCNDAGCEPGGECLSPGAYGGDAFDAYGVENDEGGAVDPRDEDGAEQSEALS
jgi:hypothetical protein